LHFITDPLIVPCERLLKQVFATANSNVLLLLQVLILALILVLLNRSFRLEAQKGLQEFSSVLAEAVMRLGQLAALFVFQHMHWNLSSAQPHDWLPVLAPLNLVARLRMPLIAYHSTS
jgi:hypothetical protein